MQLTPLEELAVSLPTSNGGYAVLLGAGISRSAAIKTGHEITQELLGRAARMLGADEDADPAGYFKERFGTPATYSHVLGVLAQTAEGRQQIIHSYFEPEIGDPPHAKQPTRAHRAIAQMVKSGYIRVILTTNFDRLMEKALNEVGVDPNIAATPQQFEQLRRLDSQRCVLIKLHGDYKDRNILNTLDELQAYDKSLQALVDRVLADYHLVVAGWSAEHDVALVEAVKRRHGMPLRTAWVIRSKPTTVAQALAKDINIQFAQAADADEFFEQLRKKITAWESYSLARTDSDELYLAEVRRIVKLDRPQVEYRELMMEELQRFLVAMQDETLFPPWNSQWSECLFADMAIRLFKIARRLRILAAYGAFYIEGIATEPILTVFETMIERVALIDPIQQKASLIPAQSLMAAVGVASVTANSYGLLSQMLQLKVRDGDPHVHGPAKAVLIPFMLYPRAAVLNRAKPSGISGSFIVADGLRDDMRSLIVNNRLYEQAFDRYELLVTLSNLVPPPGDKIIDKAGRRATNSLGAYAADVLNRVEEIPAIKRFQRELLDQGPPCKAMLDGLFFGDPKQAEAALATLFQTQSEWRGAVAFDLDNAEVAYRMYVDSFRSGAHRRP